MKLIHEEVLHATAVVVGRMRDHEDGKFQIEAIIYVERPGRKGIIVGKKGQMLKQIGIATRQEVEALLGEKVSLRLWVKVQKNWCSDPVLPRSIGYNAKELRQTVHGLCEVQGSIFKRKKYKEADVLAKIMTKDHGISIIDVRGALRPKSRSGAAALNFSYRKYTVNTNWKGISTLRTFKDVKQLDQLYLDLTKNAYSNYVLDLLDHALVEYKDTGGFYDLIMKALLKINSGEDVAIITRMVQLKLLNAYGVVPQLDRCLACGKVQGMSDCSLELGGTICSDHFNSVSQRMHPDPKVVTLIRTLALVDIDRLGKVKINP